MAMITDASDADCQDFDARIIIVTQVKATICRSLRKINGFILVRKRIGKRTNTHGMINAVIIPMFLSVSVNNSYLDRKSQ